MSQILLFLPVRTEHLFQPALSSIYIRQGSDFFRPDRELQCRFRYCYPNSARFWKNGTPPTGTDECAGVAAADTVAAVAQTDAHAGSIQETGYPFVPMA